MKHYIGVGNPMRAQFDASADYQARHFAWRFERSNERGGVGTITLNRPERKNPLTFDSSAELREAAVDMCWRYGALMLKSVETLEMDLRLVADG